MKVWSIYCQYLIILSSKGRASKGNIVLTWLSHAPRGTLSVSDYHELQKESIQHEYFRYLIIWRSKGRASNVNSVSTWLSRAPKGENLVSILSRPDYPELQRESIQGRYCLYLIVPISKGNIVSPWLFLAPKGEYPMWILSLPDYLELQGESFEGVYFLYLIILSSKGRASKGNIVSPWLSRAQKKSIQGKYCLYLIIPSSRGSASMEKTDFLLGLTTVGIILSNFSASSPGSSRSQAVPWLDRNIQWDPSKTVQWDLFDDVKKQKSLTNILNIHSFRCKGLCTLHSCCFVFIGLFKIITWVSQSSSYSTVLWKSH